MATFIHDGNSVDYTPGSAVTAGDVVVEASVDKAKAEEHEQKA